VLKNIDKNDIAYAYLSNLGLCVLEYAIGQGVLLKENICHTVSQQRSFDSACKCLTRYVFNVVKEAGQRAGKTTRLAIFAVEYIKQNYMNPNLTTVLMSSILSVSNSHFSTIFKNFTGDTFVSYLQKYRIDMSSELLLTTDMFNYEIAAAVGYDNPGYFRRVFKKHVGVTPYEFRLAKRSSTAGAKG
jgi:two-component system response regulator YesN